MRIAFFGTPEFAATHLVRLIEADAPIARVYTNPDRPRGRHHHELVSPEVKVVAERHGLPVEQPPSARKRAFIDAFAAEAFDLAIVVAYGQILPLRLLESTRLGFVNVHASLLPRWRGAAPIQWALMAGDRVTGVTLQKVVRELDAGPILAQREFPIDETIDAATLFGELAQLGATMLVQDLPALLSGDLHVSAREQDRVAVTHAPPLTKRHGQIDWRAPATAIRNRLRGVTPWPGMWMRMPTGMRVRVHELSVVGGAVETREPGTLAAVETDALVIACGRDRLRITDLQPEGKRRMETRAWLAGHHPEVGAVLPNEGDWSNDPI